MVFNAFFKRYVFCHMTDLRRYLFGPIFVSTLMMSCSSFADDAPIDTFRVVMGDQFQSDILSIAVNRRGELPDSMAVKDCPEINDPVVKNSQRTTIELVIICNVLKNGNLARNLKVVPSPNRARAVLTLLAGDADALGNSIFRSAIHEHNENLLISDQVLGAKDFPVGVFTAPNRNDVLEFKTIGDLHKMRGITVESWTMDRKTMEGLFLSKVVLVPTYDLIGKMIKWGRADFTFSSLNKDTTTDMGVPLQRLENVKVYLKEGRVFALSREQNKVFDALQDFIRTSRSQSPDPIVEAYYHSGFLATDYDDWRVLGAD